MLYLSPIVRRGLLLGLLLFAFPLLFPALARGQAPIRSTTAPDSSFDRASPTDTLQGGRSIDFRHAPPRWKTLISFPDDRQKSLVNETGALVYDFGPGPYAKPKTTVQIGLQNDTLHRTDQRLMAPKVPVVITERGNGKTHLRQEAFALVLDSSRISPPPPDTFRVDRQNGRTRALGWAEPKGPADPAFRNVAWGTNRPVRYRIDVAPNSRKQIALGFCDAYREPGGIRRVMELQVEGAPTKRINPAKEGGTNVPQVVLFKAKDADGNGEVEVEIAASSKTEDPNVFVNALWMFEAGANVNKQALVRGGATERAEVYVDSGREAEQRRAPRIDALRASLEGPQSTPVVRVRTQRSLSFNASAGGLYEAGRPFIVTKPAATGARQTEHGWVLTFPSGIDTASVLVVRGQRVPENVTRVPDLAEARAEAAQYWRSRPLPWDQIHLPDPAMQAFLETSIRTVYQLREPVEGVPQFQPGATVYRGLWAAHLPRVGRAVSTLGDTAAARRSLERLLHHQKAEGQIVVLTPPTLLKETGTALKALYHQARLAGDKAWLARQWPHLEQAVQWIRAARNQAPDDPTAPNYGLMPAALSDGGVGGIVPEYTTVHWSLIGLRSAVDAARWLGKTEQALEWQAEYADFWAAYRRGVARDLRRDEHGNWFLPIRMNFDPDKHLSQRSQINVCHMIYPGRLYEKDDWLVDGTLGMLRDAESAHGLPVSVGWLDGGVWAEVGFTCAQAHLWNGDVQNTLDLYYAAANHAAPTRGWVEEQMPGGPSNRIGGDVPHGNASAEFINLTRTLLAMEQDDRLALLAGLPPSWVAPGATLRVEDVRTTFGSVSLSLSVSDDGDHATLSIDPPDPPPADGAPVVHLRALKSAGYARPDGTPLPDRWVGRWGEEAQLRFRKKHP
jgi:hypothetical protein